jgi:protein TonB
MPVSCAGLDIGGPAAVVEVDRPMRLSVRLVHPAFPPVLARLAIALAASLALHAAVVLTFAAAPEGTLSGEAARSDGPLKARLATTPSPTPAPAPRLLRDQPDKTAPRQAATPSTGHATSALPVDGIEQAFGILPEPIYYAASELDVRPRPREPVDPPYPRVAPPDGGYLILEVLIDETGMVERVNVAVADPEGFFEQTAIDAFSAARFVPGRLNGVAVKSRTWIELRFHALAPPAAVAAQGAEPAPR